MLQCILIHGVFVANEQVEEMTTLPGSDKGSNNVADSVLVGPLAPLTILVVLISKVLPQDTGKRSRWVKITS